MNNKIDIGTIRNGFEKEIRGLCKRYSIFKMSEDLFRFTLYKKFMKQIGDKYIRFEANKGNADQLVNKIDFSVDDNKSTNKILIEMKYHRGLEKKEGKKERQRPYAHDYGRLLADFLKLSTESIKDYDRYIIYLFDENYMEYYRKREKNSIFGLVKNNSKKTIQINIDLDKINKTMKKQIEHFFKGKKKQKTTITTIKTEVIHNSIIHTSKNLLDNPKLYLKIYKIK